MAFDPENPVNPQDLVATFDMTSRLNGLLYKSPDGATYSRINGEWRLLTPESNPLGSGAYVVFVNPKFIMEFDARMMYREYILKEQVQKEFGVKPKFAFDPEKEGD